MDENKIKDAVLDAIIIAMEAQTNALKRLRKQPAEKRKTKRVGLSQVDLVEDILQNAGESLHVSDIIEQVEKAHRVKLDRESIVSSLTKKVTRGDRFERTGKNTFALKRGDK